MPRRRPKARLTVQGFSVPAPVVDAAEMWMSVMRFRTGQLVRYLLDLGVPGHGRRRVIAIRAAERLIARGERAGLVRRAPGRTWERAAA